VPVRPSGKCRKPSGRRERGREKLGQKERAKRRDLVKAKKTMENKKQELKAGDEEPWREMARPTNAREVGASLGRTLGKNILNEIATSWWGKLPSTSKTYNAETYAILVRLTLMRD
jgi:hypothetical protein